MQRAGGYAPSPEARAIAAASIRAGAWGASAVTLVFAVMVIAADVPSFAEVLSGFLLFALLFALAFAAGTVLTGFMLLMLGAAIARLSRDWLASPGGLGLALVSALAASAAFGLLFAGVEGFSAPMLLALPYAVPAAIIYRQEILLERVFERDQVS